MFGGNRNQPSSNEDRPVVIDGRTGQVIDDTRDPPRDTGRGLGNQGGQDRGSARWIHDEYGRPAPYTPGSEW